MKNMSIKHYVLQQLLPAHTCYKYVLCSRRHSYTLNIKTYYNDRNFVTRLLGKDIYWPSGFSLFLFCLICCISCILTTFY